MSTKPGVTPFTARQARDLAQQRFAMSFDAKTAALLKLQELRLAEVPSATAIAEATEDLRRITEIHAQARADLDEAIRLELVAVAKRSGITWREPRP